MSVQEPEQLTIMRQLVELSAERSYMNAERTLSVWVRTALGLIICGLAVDRFGLFLVELPLGAGQPGHYSNAISNWVGVALVALGVAMALATGLRFHAYTVEYQRHHRPPFHHHPALGPFFALMVAVFGVAVLIILIVVAW
ncbi:MAG: YidH family protein [Stellaceae bacterium]